MDELLLEGKVHVPAKQAARLYGYAADYIGQLIRGGKIGGQKVGRAWYVDLETLKAYLKIEGKDVLTPGGTRSPAAAPEKPVQPPTPIPETAPAVVQKSAARPLLAQEEHPLLTYLHDEEPALPSLEQRTTQTPRDDEEETVIPVRQIPEPDVVFEQTLPSLTRIETNPRRLLPAAAGATLSFLLATALLAGATLMTDQKIVFDTKEGTATASFAFSIPQGDMQAAVLSAWRELF